MLLRLDPVLMYKMLDVPPPDATRRLDGRPYAIEVRRDSPADASRGSRRARVSRPGRLRPAPRLGAGRLRPASREARAAERLPDVHVRDTGQSQATALPGDLRIRRRRLDGL